MGPGGRAIARALIGGGGVYSYIRVMPDKFLLKSVVFKLISKEISRAEHEYMNIHPLMDVILQIDIFTNHIGVLFFFSSSFSSRFHQLCKLFSFYRLVLN